MRRAHRLALAAAQAVLDLVEDVAGFRLLEDQALGTEQAEARRIGIAQIGTRQQLAGVEAAVGIHTLLVLGERRDLFGREVFDLGDADAMLAGDHAA